MAMRALFRSLGCLALLAAPAPATWSILIVDLATGEVAVGIATCLTGIDLRPNTVVVVPGYGVAAAQSFVGPLSLRELIRAQLLAGTPPGQILALLAAADPGHQTRQYGIVDTTGGRVTFTGTGAGAWAGGLTGTTGTLAYAIQGNVLTGAPVIQAAEQALLATPGDMAAKLMAAMQAARSMGGDGRCSCSQGAPTACGAPPPSFTKSAHIGLMIVSRPGDLDPPCSPALGCAAGQYFLDLNVANQTAAAPDPVVQLQALYDAWRTRQLGRPDHFRSTVTMSGSSLRSNGLDELTGTVTLRDAQGNALGTSVPLRVELNPRSTAVAAAFGPAVPQPNGTYTFTMRGALSAGNAIVDVVADDGLGRVVISPSPMVSIGDPFGPCGQGGIRDGNGVVFDALRIDGSGGTDRIVRLGYAQPFTLSIDPPAGAGTSPVGAFALWAYLGLPPGPIVPFGPAGGALCFLPWPLDPGAPTLLVADALGLGAPLLAMPAPWSVPFPGVPAVIDVALQGAMFVDLQGSIAATNAILLRVEALPPPAITAVQPPFGPAGTPITVTGSNFYAGLELRVAGAVTPLTGQSPTLLAFLMPAGVGCDSVLAVTNPGGMPVTAAINASPVITSTPFSTGPAAGGTFYVLAGRNLTGATVTIGGAPLVVTSQSATVITGTTPPGTPGPAVVLVRNGIGCQTTTTFTYQ